MTLQTKTVSVSAGSLSGFQVVGVVLVVPEQLLFCMQEEHKETQGGCLVLCAPIGGICICILQPPYLHKQPIFGLMDSPGKAPIESSVLAIYRYVGRYPP